MNHDPETQPLSPTGAPSPTPVQPVRPVPVQTIRPMTPAPVVPAPMRPAPVRPVTPAPAALPEPELASASELQAAPAPLVEAAPEVQAPQEAEDGADTMSLSDILNKPPVPGPQVAEAPAPQVNQEDAAPDTVDPVLPVASTEEPASDQQADPEQAKPTPRSRLADLGRRKSAASETTVITADPSGAMTADGQADPEQAEPTPRGKRPRFGRKNAATSTTTVITASPTAQAARQFGGLKWPQAKNKTAAASTTAAEADGDAAATETAEVPAEVTPRRLALPRRTAALVGLGALGVLSVALLLRPHPSEPTPVLVPSTAGVPVSPAQRAPTPLPGTPAEAKSKSGTAPLKKTPKIATPQDKTTTSNPGVQEALVKPDPAVANAFVTTGTAAGSKAATPAGTGGRPGPQVQPAQRSVPVVPPQVQASAPAPAPVQVQVNSPAPEVTSTPAAPIPAPPVQKVTTAQPPKYVPPTETSSAVVVIRPTPTTTPTRLPPTSITPTAPPVVASRPTATPRAKATTALTPPVRITVLPPPQALPAAKPLPPKAAIPKPVTPKPATAPAKPVVAAPQPQRAPDVVVLPAPTAAAPTAAQLGGANGTTPATSASANPATPALEAVPVKVQPTVEYLGYARTDTETTAMIRISGRDEIAAEGQDIPGTKLHVASVTPTSLTIESEAGTQTVPLMESAQ